MNGRQLDLFLPPRPEAGELIELPRRRHRSKRLDGIAEVVPLVPRDLDSDQELVLMAVRSGRYRRWGLPRFARAVRETFCATPRETFPLWLVAEFRNAKRADERKRPSEAPSRLSIASSESSGI